MKIEKTHVVADSHGGTGVAGLYAIGDLAGPPWLAHKASHEGIHCVEHIAGLKPANVTTIARMTPYLAMNGRREPMPGDASPEAAGATEPVTRARAH